VARETDAQMATPLSFVRRVQGAGPL